MEPARTHFDIVDVLSALFIVVFLLCPWWLYLSRPIPLDGTGIPLQLMVFLVDALPFAFGIVWLAIRYYTEGSLSVQFIQRWKLHHVLFLLFIGVPFYLMKANWR